MNWIKADEVFGKAAGPSLPALVLVHQLFGVLSLEFVGICVMIILLFAWFFSAQANRVLKRRVSELEQEQALSVVNEK